MSESEDFFKGLTIIDLTRILSGPFCTMYFADLGTNVIKIEPPDGDDTRTWGPPFQGGESSYFLSVNRNKRSMVLDLKSTEGKEVLRKLIARADIVVENFRPGTLERLGFGYETLRSLNPKIILASISGFGQTGPYRNDPGYDLIAQGMGGLMSVTGEKGAPPVKAGFSIADIGSGMWTIIGILTALLNREHHGTGEWLDVSLLDTIISWQTYIAGNYFASGNDPIAMGSVHPNICPYQAFPAKDGYFNLAVGNDSLWAAFCNALEEPDWIYDKRFATNSERVNNRQILIPALEDKFKQKTVAEWVDLFKQVKVPCGPINRMSDIFADSHVSARIMLQTINHPAAGEIKTVWHPVRFCKMAEPGAISPPPLLGEHTADILREYGLFDAYAQEVLGNLPENSRAEPIKNAI